MAKKAYIGVDNVARKVKKAYIGVGGVARKVKKAYIGIGGVARPCWSGGTLTRYGKVTNLSEARVYLASASLENYALFAGGRYFNTSTSKTVHSSKVDAYDKNLTRTSPTLGLGSARYSLTGGVVGNKAVFAGGFDSSATYYVDAYDTALTRSSPVNMTSTRANAGAATVGNYVVFHGGTVTATTIDCYDAALSRYSPEIPRTYNRQNHAATKVGNYALFAGGHDIDSQVSAVALAFDSSLTYSLPTPLSTPRAYLSATTVDGRALFAGGTYGGSVTTIDVYDSSLTRTNQVSLPSARSSPVAVSVEGFAIFAGGATTASNGATVKATDVYAFDDSLTLVNAEPLSQERQNGAAASVGHYALFTGGGGIYGDSSVEAYVVA